MGDGSVNLILDIEHIISASKTFQSSAPLKIGKAKIKKDADVNKESEKKSTIKKVLVVDDSKSIRNILCAYIRESGYETNEAVSGEEAIALIAKENYSLITIDVMMDGMDGYELTRKIRDMKNYVSTPIIMVSALTEKVNKIKGFDAGVDEYLAKPIDRETFFSLLRRMIK